jgi:hypothetical protein
MRYVAAFRTYEWDDDIARLAQRFFAACPSARHLVLADETRGPLGIRDFEVLSHTSDMSALGLVERPKGWSLWFNHDYATYLVRRAFPDQDGYIFAESDLAVNIDVDAMVRVLLDRSVDFLAHDIKPARSDWTWFATGRGLFDETWQSLLFFCFYSPRALDALYAARRDLSDRLAANQIAHWPFCELFVTSLLRQRGHRFAEAADFADTTHLRYRPRVEISNPVASRPGTLVHSVVGRQAFLRDLVARHGPSTWFVAGSPLRKALEGYDVADYAPALRAGFEAQQDALQLLRLDIELRARGVIPPPSDDLALGKPSLVSSLSAWSRFQHPAHEAAGANMPMLPADFGFHTDLEDSPWWSVDLLDVRPVSEVRIVNRVTQPGRFRNFAIDVSLDGRAWRTVFEKADGADVGSEPASAYRARIAPRRSARFLRVRKLGRGFLHLRRVSVFADDAAAG